jgi:hypothetical protein
MSMIGNLRRLSDTDLTRLLTSPTRISSYLYEAEDDEDRDGEEEFGPHADIDIDKAWHGLHFLLAGDADGGSFPLSFLLTGGTPVGEEDVGYGPARGFRSFEVKQIAAALQTIDRTMLGERFDWQKMARARIYPDVWSRRDEEVQNRDYLLDAFEVVRDFLTGAAENGEALIVYLN